MTAKSDRQPPFGHIVGRVPGQRLPEPTRAFSPPRRVRHLLRSPRALDPESPELRDSPVVRAVDEDLEPRTAAGWQRKQVHALVGLDVASAMVSAAAAVSLRFGDGASVAYQSSIVAFPLLWLIACASTRSYEPRFLGEGSEEFRRVFDAGVKLLAASAFVAYALQIDVARLFILLTFPLTVALSLSLRYVARQVLHRKRARGECLHRVVVVGRERSSSELVRQLRRETHAGFSVVGACVDRPSTDSVEGVPIVGTSASIIEALQITGADTVAIGAWSDLTQADLRRLSWQLEGSGVSLVVAPSVTDVTGPRIHIRPVSGLPLLHLEH